MPTAGHGCTRTAATWLLTPYRTSGRCRRSSGSGIRIRTKRGPEVHGAATTWSPPRSLLAQRVEDRSLDETLREVHLVGVQAHRARDGPDLRGGLIRGRLDVLALEEVLDDLGAVRNGRDATERDPPVLPVATRDGEHGGDRDEREVVDLAILELRPSELGAAGRIRNGHVGHEFIRLEDVLAEHVHTWAGEVVVERDCPLPAGTRDLRRGIEREERGGGVRGVNDVAELSADDRGVAVVTGHGVAEVATLLVAVEVLTTEEPAARTLVDVSAERPEVADERRRHAERRVGEHGQLRCEVLVVDDVAQGRGGADRRASTVGLDPDDVLDGRDVDEDLRQGHALSLDPVLHHAADDVAATADDLDRAA